MQKSGLLILALLLAASAAAAGPVPHINQPLVPDTAPPGGGPITLTVNGIGFVSGATVRWNGAALTTRFVSNTQLSAFVPAADLSSPTTATVTAANPGTAVASDPVYFPVGNPSKTVYYNSAPGSPLRPAEGFGIVGADGVADFNNDGEADLMGYLFGAQGPPTNGVLLGKGDGTFTLAPETPNPSGYSTYATGDFNGDGKLDLFAFDKTTGNALTLLGNGDGTFIAGPVSATGFAQQFTGPVSVEDFNGDGNLDVLTEGSAADGSPSGAVQLFFGNGDGTFTLGPETQLPSGFHLMGVGDFNGDGKWDLIIYNYLNAVAAMLGNGDGTFRAAPGSPVSAVGDIGNNVAVADFNGDGKQDIAVPNFDGAGLPPVAVLLGNGDGSFTRVPNCCGSPQVEIDGLWMATADLNDDGKLDLALTIENQQSVTNPLPVYIEVLLGSGDGTFTPTDWTMFLLCQWDWPWIADFNGDGRLDFVTRNEPCGEAQVLLQGPLSGPAPDFTISASQPALTVAAGGTATDEINIAEVGGLLAPTSPLTCSGLPSKAACAFAQLPGMIIPTARGSFQMTVTTRAPAYPAGAVPALAPGNRPLLEWATAAAGLILLLTLALTHRKRAHWRLLPLAPLAALLVCAASWTSCGAGPPASQTPRLIPGTPPGTYTLVVTETVGSITHSANIQLTVE